MLFFELILPCPILPTEFPEDPFHRKPWIGLRMQKYIFALSIGSPHRLSISKFLEDALNKDPHLKEDINCYLETKELLEKTRIVITPLLEVQGNLDSELREQYYKEIMYIINVLCYFEENLDFLKEKGYKIHVFSI